MATDSKIKLFIFLIFVVVAIVLVTEVASFLRGGFSAIDNKKQEIACTNVKIIDSTYANKNLLVEISTIRKNITQLTIINSDKTEAKYTIDTIYAGETKTITIPNITLSKKYKIYAENCIDYIFENEI